MTEDLRKDLLLIVLEEAYAMREDYARKLLMGRQAPNRFSKADSDALDGANTIVNRIDARCSKIEG